MLKRNWDAVDVFRRLLRRTQPTKASELTTGESASPIAAVLRDPAHVGEGELVAGERLVCEDVDDDVAEAVGHAATLVTAGRPT